MPVPARSRRDAGSTTAETAVLLPVLVVVLLLAVWVLTCVGAQLRCVDAARAGARVAARGEPTAAVVEAARAVAPASAQVRVVRRDDEVEVLVTARVQPLGRVLAALPATPVSARAAALVEEPGGEP